MVAARRALGPAEADHQPHGAESLLAPRDIRTNRSPTPAPRHLVGLRAWARVCGFGATMAGIVSEVQAVPHTVVAMAPVSY